MRVLIVDDEAPARAKLRRMLGDYPDVAIVGEAGDGVRALDLVAQLRPCAVFLDVQMPLLDGMAASAAMPRPRPRLVFVTAYEQHAVGAFDAEATDYLLKPVDSERLDRAVQRLRAPPLRITTGPQVRACARLVVAERGRTTVVDCAEIEWLGAEDNYVRVQANGRSFLLRRTLADLLDEVGPGVVRIHRSAAVALARVCCVRARPKGDATVLLQSGVELACSRQYRASLMQRLRNG